MGDCIKNMTLRVSCIHSWGERFWIEHPPNMEGMESQVGKVGGSRYLDLRVLPELWYQCSDCHYSIPTKVHHRGQPSPGCGWALTQTRPPNSLSHPSPGHGGCGCQTRPDAAAPGLSPGPGFPLPWHLLLTQGMLHRCLTFCFFCRHLPELTSDACLQLQ